MGLYARARGDRASTAPDPVHAGRCLSIVSDPSPGATRTTAGGPHAAQNGSAPSTGREPSIGAPTPQHAHEAGSERRQRLARLPQRRTRALLALDAVGLFSLMMAIHGVRYALDLMTTVYPLQNYVIGFGIATGIHLAVLYFGGLYEREERLGSRPRLPRALALIGVAVLLCAGIALLTGQYLMPRGNLVILFVLGALLVVANRRIVREIQRRRHPAPRVLLVGEPHQTGTAAAQLRELDADDLEVAGEVREADDLPAHVERASATDVLLLSNRTLDDVYPEPLATLERRGVGVLQMVRPSNSMLGLRGISELGGMPVVALRSHVLTVSERQLKRLEDLLLLLVTAPVTVPLTGLTALYVRLVAGAPVLYRQERVGQGGRVFSMVKFRTMRPNAEAESGAVWAQRRDPRVVRGLGWLRDARLDELPQLWNVLRGEMTVVGPRPERPELVAQFERAIPGYERRGEVPPGITGLAQVHGRYHTDPEYKLGHDLQYLVNWSPVLDLQILLRTLWVILARRV